MSTILLTVQAKIMRLSGSASASAQELLEQLKKGNAMLLADNERLLSHVEGLESKGSGSASAGGPCPKSQTTTVSSW